MSDGQTIYLYAEIKERIKEDTKHLPPHARIDTRTAMIKKYNVTRTTIEKAISTLIGENFLYSRDGSGTYIAEKAVDKTNSSIAKWGVILPNIISDTFPEILRGIEDFAHDNNVNVIICNTDHDVQKQTHYINKLVDSGIQGLIIVPAITEAPAMDSFSILTQKNLPFVFCVRGEQGVKAPRVMSNNFFGAYIATKHLIRSGYSRIAFVSRPLYSGSEQRYQGYLAALNEAGLQVHPEYIVFEESFRIERPGYESGMSILQLDPHPDAVFCFNDGIAKGVYEAAEPLGLKVGKDIGIVGYDDNKLCHALPVKLTSVRYPKYETGNKAAEILMQLIRGDSVDPNYSVILQPELIVRQSCKKAESRRKAREKVVI